MKDFVFKFMSQIDMETIDKVRTELLQLQGWKSHTAPALSTSHRTSVALRMSPFYPPASRAPASMIDTCADRPWYTACTQTKRLIARLMDEHGWTKLGLATVSRMAPGGVIAEHSDDGPYFEYFNRVQIPLQAEPGIRFTCESETIEMKAGEAWCFDHTRRHSVVNHSTIERVNLYFDAK